MSRPPSRILILLAHPAPRSSRVNQALWQAAGNTAADPSRQIERRDLYALYPDYAVDVAAEQAALAAADLVVWLHPIHWYSMPALMKLWVDEVLTLGWAYGKGGTALHHKSLWLVASTGGSDASYSTTGYNQHRFEAFLPPYEQTAALCGMRFLPPMILHGAHGMAESVLAAHTERFTQQLSCYPDWCMEIGTDQVECEVPSGDRPASKEVPA